MLVCPMTAVAAWMSSVLMIFMTVASVFSFFSLNCFFVVAMIFFFAICAIVCLSFDVKMCFTVSFVSFNVFSVASFDFLAADFFFVPCISQCLSNVFVCVIFGA